MSARQGATSTVGCAVAIVEAMGGAEDDLEKVFRIDGIYRRLTDGRK